MKEITLGHLCDIFKCHPQFMSMSLYDGTKYDRHSRNLSNMYTIVFVSEKLKIPMDRLIKVIEGKDQLLTTQETVDLLGYTRVYLTHYLKYKPAFRLGTKFVRYSRNDIVKWEVDRTGRICR